MKRTVGGYAILLSLVFGFSGCAANSRFIKRVRHNEVVLGVWARGKRAEEKGNYQRAKEKHYVVKRFATTYYLKEAAPQRNE
ncbi:MAG: hypothetical protein GTN74_17710 [Proteobacteria bacterium]|nr:hypothetical protein [Pseudomonadota bacterium]NIS72705.1 hypothetical protein [Pseudomonadota bacterium]